MIIYLYNFTNNKNVLKNPKEVKFYFYEDINSELSYSEYKSYHDYKDYSETLQNIFSLVKDKDASALQIFEFHVSDDDIYNYLIDRNYKVKSKIYYYVWNKTCKQFEQVITFKV